MNDEFSRVVAVVPSLSPDEKLPNTVKGLLDAGFRRVIVVDDGSKAEYGHRFEECAAHAGVTLLRHEVNKGKGAAMKTAFSHVLAAMPDCTGVVTVDGDGQHRPEDCRNCSEAMLRDDKIVLGVRDFTLPDVPKRSRRGNHVTSAVFRIFCGMKLSDTQTGLRAIPIDLLPQILKVKGDRYEFETQMLLDFKTYRIPYEEVKIETVYIEENQTSHFRVVRDSFRIYKMILAHFLKFSATSVGSFFLEEGILALVLFMLLSATGETNKNDLGINAVAFLIARFSSSVFNVLMNYFVVFKAKCSFWKAALKYYAICIPLAAVQLPLILLSLKGVNQWGFLPPQVEKYAQLIIQPLVQVILFLATYGLQREWVYKTDKKHQVHRGTKKNAEKDTGK